MLSPLSKPARPFFSSGPCAKPLGWGSHILDHFLAGRSHRSAPAIQQIQTVLLKTRLILKIPDDYVIAIVPGSATGAIEMGLWNLLGCRGVDVWSFDVFGERWATDIRQELRLEDVRFFEGSARHLPDFSQVDPKRDQVFTWGGTTSGLWLQELDWLPAKREGLTICDATSVIFATDLPWHLLDFTAFSWQKGLGSEAGQGVIVLSPRALERLRTYKPVWPIPRSFTLHDDCFIKNNQIEGSLFSGMTLNTLSLMTIADCLWTLDWAEKQGGLKGLLQRVQHNFDILEAWVDRTPWVSFLSKEARMRSKVAVCLEIVDPFITALSRAQQWRFLEEIGNRLAQAHVAFDCLNHAFAEPGFRFWCGPTIESQDLADALPWVDFLFGQVKEQWQKEQKEQKEMLGA